MMDLVSLQRRKACCKHIRPDGRDRGVLMFVCSYGVLEMHPTLADFGHVWQKTKVVPVFFRGDSN